MKKEGIKKLGFSFLPIPEELMRSKAISWGAKHLWGIFAKANMEKVKWSASYLAKRMGCDIREARRRKKELTENNLILVTPKSGQVDEVSVNLQLIQVVQTPDQTVRGGVVETDRGIYIGSNKEHSIKTMSDEPTDWDFAKKLSQMTKDSRRHIQIIALYWKEKGWEFDNEKKYRDALDREHKPASKLTGYTDEEIKETIEVLKGTSYLTKFGLETVRKYIDEVIVQKKKEGPKIIRFEEIKRSDGKIAMKPIYAK